MGDYAVRRILMKQIKTCSHCVGTSLLLLEPLGIELNVSHASETSKISQQLCQNLFSISQLIHSNSISTVRNKDLFHKIRIQYAISRHCTPNCYTLIMMRVFYDNIWPLKTKEMSCLSIDKSIQVNVAFIRKPYIQKEYWIIVNHCYIKEQYTTLSCLSPLFKCCPVCILQAKPLIFLNTLQVDI